MNNHNIETICLHHGAVEDTVHRGAISPIYMSTAYEFNDVKQKRYPRYINTPNQEGLCKKIAAIENVYTKCLKKCQNDKIKSIEKKIKVNKQRYEKYEQYRTK